MPTFTIGGEVAPAAPTQPTQQTSKVKVVNQVYDKIDDDAYSLNLNYKGRDYTMVIDRDGEITDASYYNPNTLKDVDVKSSFFKFTSEDIKNIFSEIEQPTQQASVETTDDSGMPTFTIGEDAIGTPAQQAEAQEKIDSLEDQINQAISDMLTQKTYVLRLTKRLKCLSQRTGQT